MPDGISAVIPQLLYSVVFFGAATAVAMHPEKLTEYLGKRLTPILLVLIIVLFAAGVIMTAGGNGVLDASGAEPAELYVKGAAVQGFLDGC